MNEGEDDEQGGGKGHAEEEPEHPGHWPRIGPVQPQSPQQQGGQDQYGDAKPQEQPEPAGLGPARFGEERVVAQPDRWRAAAQAQVGPNPGEKVAGAPEPARGACAVIF